MRTSLRTFLSILRWDIKLQIRYYFWITAAVVSCVWLLLLLALTEQARALWIPVLIFADISNIGLLFIAGILFLERRQGTIYAAAVMPVSGGVWLAAKLLSLVLLCTVCAVVIVFFNVESVNWLRMIPAIVLTAALFTSLGFILACPFENIMNFFLVMALALGVLNIPLLAYLGIIESPLLWVFPTQASLWLLAGSLQEMSAVSFYSALLLLLAWLALFHWLGVKAFNRFIKQI